MYNLTVHLRPSPRPTAACFGTGGFTSFSDASHCFYLTLPTGNIWKLTLLTHLFVQPIDAHDFNIFLFDTSFNARKEFLWSAPQSLIRCSESGCRKWQCHSLNHSWWQLENMAARGWAGWWQYAKFSPHGITEKKRRTASYFGCVLLSYKLIFKPI